MARPGMLTGSRANRAVKTPGGRIVIHRRKIYSSKARCGVTGRKVNVTRGARQDKIASSSRSAKRPNRPYGGVAAPAAAKRSVIRKVREL